jgi:asparagine synthase (glutamine-hydrolysing)
MDEVGSKDPLAPFSTLDLQHYLPDDILTKVDRMSMAHSLELRAPFLDYRVVELAATWPAEWKINEGATKIVLKETFGDDLPPAVLKQRKWGFSLPIEHWLRQELRPVLEDALNDSQIESSGIFCMKEIRSLAHEHLSGARERTDVLWRYLFFTRWWHRCYASRPRVQSLDQQDHAACYSSVDSPKGL